MASLLITNGTIINAADKIDADVLIENGRIVRIEKGIKATVDRTLDSTGKLLLPGGIDVHTHLDMPFGGTSSADDFYTGHVAAAFGGTTTHLDFSIQGAGEGLYPALERWHEKASGKAVIDYGFHMIVREMNDQVLADMDALAGQEGVPTFKFFMAYPGVFMVDDGLIFEAMLRARENGGLIMMHAENGGAIDTLVKLALAKGQTEPKYHALTRPPLAEGEATGRAIDLAHLAGAPLYIVHVTCFQALDRIRRARDAGWPVYGETCPQYLVRSYEDYERPDFEGAKFVMSPPLREKWHAIKLWQGLERNGLQVVSTDHCPFGFENPPQKQLGRNDFSKIPNGAPGIEDRMMVMWEHGVNSGRFDAHRFVELTSANPARLFNLWPRKGTIAVGSDADIVLWDTKKKTTLSAKTHHMNVDYNLFEGMTVTGGPSVVISRGEVLVENDTLMAKAGRGQFLKRPAGAPALA
ncbi:MAG: dihydropyrimidinase [Candidatus Eisenbacteria bacterium]|nr:dihydropyrimidinase [Candidatus Eisenbacteria bacterium]